VRALQGPCHFATGAITRRARLSRFKGFPFPAWKIGKPGCANVLGQVDSLHELGDEHCALRIEQPAIKWRENLSDERLDTFLGSVIPTILNAHDRTSSPREPHDFKVFPNHYAELFVIHRSGSC
jgi:hypothetical protein